MLSARPLPTRRVHSRTGRRCLRAAVALCTLVPALAAQGHLGSDFWLPDPYSTATTFTIAIGNPGSVTANVAIVNPIEGTTSDTVGPGVVKTYTFPDHEIALQGSFVSANPVYHVTSDVAVA